MILKKLAAVGVSFFVTMICFALFKWIAHAETDMKKIYYGLGMIMTTYALPFMIFGALLTCLVDAFRFSRNLHRFFGYLLAATITAGVVISGLLRFPDLAIFVAITCLVNTFVFFFVHTLVIRRSIQILLAAIPLIYLIALDMTT